MVAATVAIAWRSDAAAAAVPAVAGLAALVVISWSVQPVVERLVLPGGPSAGAIADPAQAQTGFHLALGAFFALLFGAAGFLAQGRSQRPLVPMLWAASSALAPIAILIALYYRVAGWERSIPFAGLALVLAALFAVATETLTRRAPRPGGAAAQAIFASGAVAALALAMTFALEKGWLTVALALMVPGIAWIAEQRPLPMLRWLAATIVALVLARIGWEPRIVGSDVGTTPIFNWLLYGYGVPALAFWVGGHLLRERADDVPARTVDAAAILFTVLLGFLEIRHYMNDGDVFADSSGLGELALQVSLGLAMAIGLERLRGRTRSIVHNAGALIIAGLALAGIVFGLGLSRKSAGHGRAGRRHVLQPDPARLWAPGRAGDRARPHRPRDAPDAVSRDGGGRQRRPGAALSVARGRAPLSGPRPHRGPGDRCRAIHLFGGLAVFRRRSAARSASPCPPSPSASLRRRSPCSPSARCSSSTWPTSPASGARCRSSGSDWCWSASAISTSVCCFRGELPPPPSA